MDDHFAQTPLTRAERRLARLVRPEGQATPVLVLDRVLTYPSRPLWYRRQDQP